MNVRPGIIWLTRLKNIPTKSKNFFRSVWRITGKWKYKSKENIALTPETHEKERMKSKGFLLILDILIQFSTLSWKYKIVFGLQLSTFLKDFLKRALNFFCHRHWRGTIPFFPATLMSSLCCTYSISFCLFLY